MNTNNAPAVNTSARLLRLPEVRERTGLPTSTLYALMDSGEFPRPIKLSARSVAWDESLVTGWIAQKLAASQAS
jgi:prophage regulatory protein